MPSGVESQYKDLLNPVKDLEKAMSINISELMCAYMQEVSIHFISLIPTVLNNCEYLEHSILQLI